MHCFPGQWMRTSPSADASARVWKNLEYWMSNFGTEKPYRRTIYYSPRVFNYSQVWSIVYPLSLNNAGIRRPRSGFCIFFSCYYLGIFERCVCVYVRSGEHGSSQTETEYNFNLRNNLMRVNSDTLLFGTVIKKTWKKYKSFQNMFF